MRNTVHHLLLLATLCCSLESLAETYNYDAQGRLVSILYDDGSRIAWIYDDDGNILQRTTAQAGFADLELLLSTDLDPAVYGEELLYTITITNTGPSLAQGVDLTFTLPDGIELLRTETSQGRCGEIGTTVACSIGLVSAGEVAQLTIAVQPLTTDPLQAEAVVTAVTTDPNGANNSQSTSVLVEDVDSDGDSINNSVELSAPNAGDGNGDGEPDHRQPYVVSLPSGAGRDYMTVEVGGACDGFTLLSTLPEGALPVDDLYFAPNGYMRFSAACESALITHFLHRRPDLHEDSRLRAYTAATPGDGATRLWADLGASFAVVDVGGVATAIMATTIVDGGLGDDTTVDGVIEHVGSGLGLPRPRLEEIPQVPWSENEAVLTSPNADSELALPFVFPFFGRDIEKIHIANTGIIELLTADESCEVCGHPGGHRYGNDLDPPTDLVYAAIDWWTGATAVDANDQRVRVLWTTQNPYQYGESYSHLTFSITLWADGEIEWHFFDMAGQDFLDYYGGDMFSGIIEEGTLTDIAVPGWDLLAGPADVHRAYRFDTGTQLITEVVWPDQFQATALGTLENAWIELPFELHFFGHQISAVNVTTDGTVELLEPDWPPLITYGPTAHQSEDYLILDVDMLFSLNSDLWATAVVEQLPDRLIVTWMGSTFEAQNIRDNPVVASVTLHETGQIDWKVYSTPTAVTTGDLFTGLFSCSGDVEAEVEGGSNALLGQPDAYLSFSLDAPADLALFLDFDGRLPTKNSRLELVYNIENLGGAEATNVTLTAPIPQGATLLGIYSPGSTCSGTAVVQCTADAPLARDDLSQVVILLELEQTGLLQVSGNVTADERDDDLANNAVAQDLEVLEEVMDADLSMTLTADADVVQRGEETSFTATATNLGPADASGVIVRFPMSSDELAVDAVVADGTCGLGAPELVVCIIGTILAGDSIDIQLVVFPLEPGVLSQTTSLSANESDSNPYNDSAQVDVMVQAVDAGIIIPDAGLVILPPRDGGSMQDIGVIADAADTDLALADTNAADTTASDTYVADTIVEDTYIADTTVADTNIADTTVADTNVVDTTAVADIQVFDVNGGPDRFSGDDDDDDDDDEGCGCAAAGTKTPGPLLLWCILFVAYCRMSSETRCRVPFSK